MSLKGLFIGGVISCFLWWLIILTALHLWGG